MAGNGLAINPLGLFGEKFDKGGSIANFALGLSQRFALFCGQYGGKIISVLRTAIYVSLMGTTALAIMAMWTKMVMCS